MQLLESKEALRVFTNDTIILSTSLNLLWTPTSKALGENLL